MKHYNDRIRELREEHNMTQKQVAEVLGVAQPVYQRFEKGIFECNYDQLVKLSDLFGVSVDYLLGKADI